jgi:hypothetical protein
MVDYCRPLVIRCVADRLATTVVSDEPTLFIIIVIIIIIIFFFFFFHGLGHELFRHRRVAIVSWGVHDLFFLEVCS